MMHGGVGVKHIKALMYVLLTGTALLITTSASAQNHKENRSRSIYITVGSTHGDFWITRPCNSRSEGPGVSILSIHSVKSISFLSASTHHPTHDPFALRDPHAGNRIARCPHVA